MDDHRILVLIEIVIFTMIGFGISKLYKNEMEKYPQKAKSYYEEQFTSAGDTLIINKYTDDYKVDMIKYGESKGYKLKETKIENNWFSDDTTLVFEKIIRVSMSVILFILGYLYFFNYIKAKNIIRIIMALILLAGIVFLIKM